MPRAVHAYRRSERRCTASRPYGRPRPQDQHAHRRRGNDGRSDFTRAADFAQGGVAPPATPVAAAIAQPAAAVGHQEARVSIFGSSAISMSEPTRPRAKAFSTAWSDSGRRRCAPSCWRWRFANLRRAGPSAGCPSTGISRSISVTMPGFWDAPEDEQGREVVRQYSVSLPSFAGCPCGVDPNKRPYPIDGTWSATPSRSAISAS